MEGTIMEDIKMTPFHILIVDDEEAIRESLAAWLIKEGYQVDTAASGKHAMEKLRKDFFDLALVDIKMPGMDGIELLSLIRDKYPEILVVIITAYGSIETAVDAMKQGASDYLVKPFDPEHLILLITKLSKQKALMDENLRLRARLTKQDEIWLEDLLGQSQPMRRVFEEIERIAQTDTPILITGETGTGKELVARAIHSRSHRAFAPFVAINCGAMEKNLLESELFGHERGAFTGAVQARRGRLEIADTGTLFLDEVGEISAHMQVNLLRVLEEGTFFRLGGSREVTSNFRLICATHRDLPTLMESDRFRQDFYFRINVINVQVPPLRERGEDIPLLALHFIQRFSKEMGKTIEGLSSDALNLLGAYDWPGNVRELKNVMERAVVLSQEEFLSGQELTFLTPDTPPLKTGKSLQDMEAFYIQATLELNDWNISKSAKVLGIDRSTLSRKIKNLKIEKSLG